MRILLLCLWSVSLLLGQPVFVATANLQSIAARVADKQGRDVQGLTASDFTILEDGHPQPIAFFAAENQPVSLAILLDSSWSMRSSNKLERARKLLTPLLRGNLTGNEIFFASFTDRVGPFLTLAPNQSLESLTPPARSAGSGTSLYDALATSLCTLRNARNVRQAVVIITDGSDQHSRLSLERLVSLAQSSKPQIFMIGFFDPIEHALYKESGKTVSLVNGREIDNPLKTFERIAKESGAESFFPSSDQDLAKVVDHILGILQAEYTLAYYPKSVLNLRRIQVRVNRRGVTITARRAVGSVAAGGEAVQFSADSCAISATEHPYPWEPHFTTGLPHTSIYRDDFSDPASGWPNRPFWGYRGGGYEITVGLPPHNQAAAPPLQRGMPPASDLTWGGDPGGTGEFAISPGKIVAYGPIFDNFRASISVAGKWARILSPENVNKYTDGGAGLVFRLNETGCYLLLLSGAGRAEQLSFKLVKVTWSGPETQIIPLRQISPPRPTEETTITVECSAERIVALVNGLEVARVTDTSFSSGQVGVAAFGKGHAVFHNLEVEERP